MIPAVFDAALSLNKLMVLRLFSQVCAAKMRKAILP
jgi:hypothetical protein